MTNNYFSIYDGQWYSDTEISFILDDETGELIDRVDEIRRELGYKDLVSDSDNDVYYNFYLLYRPADSYIKVTATCNNGEEDDWHSYELPMDKDSMDILRKMAKAEFKRMEDEEYGY